MLVCQVWSKNYFLPVVESEVDGDFVNKDQSDCVDLD